MNSNNRDMTDPRVDSKLTLTQFAGYSSPDAALAGLTSRPEVPQPSVPEMHEFMGIAAEAMIHAGYDIKRASDMVMLIKFALTESSARHA